jgi:hypothetical protein
VRQGFFHHSPLTIFLRERTTSPERATGMPLATESQLLAGATFNVIARNTGVRKSFNFVRVFALAIFDLNVTLAAWNARRTVPLLNCTWRNAQA